LISKQVTKNNLGICLTTSTQIASSKHPSNCFKSKSGSNNNACAFEKHLAISEVQEMVEGRGIQSHPKGKTTATRQSTDEITRKIAPSNIQIRRAEGYYAIPANLVEVLQQDHL
jgi:hypothetical protein